MDEIIKERILRNLKKNAATYFYSDRHIALREMYLEEPNGCVPEAYLGDDVNKNIYEKFYAVLDAIREEVGVDGIDIYIDVSYESDTVFIMTCGKTVLYKGYSKAWNFWWETLGDLEDYVYQIYREIMACLAQRDGAKQIEIIGDIAAIPGIRIVTFSTSYAIEDAETDEEATEQAEGMLIRDFEQCQHGITDILSARVIKKG